ncbi:MAG: aminotransferase class I/II-fold pyridoxal phosphate-dependent enzyme, partial [Chitinophagaceae bacterium]|nr:aminotransferase class I/II-fold pyridoxal phosphate-dependent enzyme [Chitinophagaceae bacterium]
MKEDFLITRLNERRERNAYRELLPASGKADFCSNDYLGIVKNKVLNNRKHTSLRSGSTGSRLLSGNYEMIEHLEKQVAAFHGAASGLVFNSGYDANIGLLGSVARKGDSIIYDFLSHASLRDGIRLSAAQAFPFLHNDMESLEKRLKACSPGANTVFVVTESVFSMDGDLAPLQEIADLCKRYEANLIVDEAHATGVLGPGGAGLVQSLSLQHACFARIHTFGKAVGCHGAVVLGSDVLRNFLINFCRPFIYTTALPESSIFQVSR